jgi:alpha/beta hydrolase fold
MHKIQALQKDALTEGASSPGITRHVALKGEGVQVVRSRVEPGIVSGWHHHGDYTVYGYVVSGTVRLEGGPGGRDTISVGPGGSSPSRPIPSIARSIHLPPRGARSSSSSEGPGRWSSMWRWTRPGEMEATMPNVEVNGTTLAYAEQGTGQPVVFVHGGSGDLRVWANQIEAFASKYRAIAVSCRHYYPNEPIHEGEDLPLDTHVADLAAFLRALDLAPAHLVGHSSPGAFGGLLLARKEPALIRTLVLAEPPALPLLGLSLPPKPRQILRLLLREPRTALAVLKFGAKGIAPPAGPSRAATTSRACRRSYRLIWARRAMPGSRRPRASTCGRISAP